MRPIFVASLVATVVITLAWGGSPLYSAPGGTAPAAGSGSASKPAKPGAPATTCAVTTCAFHAGAGSYFTCLAGGAGSCFHFGGPCAPADGCMYDPNARIYKACAHAVEGACDKWVAACTPSSRCMFDPKDNLHRHCDAPNGDGTCKTWGALCAPSVLDAS